MKLYTSLGGDFIELPPFNSVSRQGLNQRNKSYSFNTNTAVVVNEIQDFLFIMNNKLSNQTAVNINNKEVGDYTCWFEDERGALFKAIVEMTSNNDESTRFSNSLGWQSDAMTFSLSVREVFS